MKLYELYARHPHKKPLNEGKLIAESIKLCQAVTALLESYGSTSKAEIQMQISGLRHQYQQEMIAQNNKSSAVRSYAGADRIAKQIDALDRQLLQTNEGEGDFEFEPDPAYAGVKGINRDTGAGNQAAAQAQRGQAQVKINATWQKMLHNAKAGGAEGQQKMMPYLQKLVKVATQKGFKLDPDPATIMGLGGLQ